MVETVSWLVRVHVSHSGASDFSRVKLEEDSIDVFETLDVCVDEILELDHPPVGTSTITVTSVAPEVIGSVVVEVYGFSQVVVVVVVVVVSSGTSTKTVTSVAPKVIGNVVVEV